MSYFFLALGIVFEIASLVALKETAGFTRPIPVLLFLFGMVASFYLESLALRTLPISMTYAVWAGVGIVGMALIGALVYGESLNGGVVSGLVLILAGVLVMYSWSPDITDKESVAAPLPEAGRIAAASR